MRSLKFGAAVGLVFLSCAALAQQPYVFTPLGYQQVTSLGTAKGLQIPTGTAPKIIEICVASSNIRYRDDGTAPTATVGIPVASGTCFQYSGSLTAIQFIDVTSSAVLNVSYYR